MIRLGLVEKNCVIKKYLLTFQVNLYLIITNTLVIKAVSVNLLLRSLRMDPKEIFAKMVEEGAADLFIKTGSKPHIKNASGVFPLDFPEIDKETANKIYNDIATIDRSVRRSEKPS